MRPKVALDPADSEGLYFGTTPGQLFFSADGGTR